MFYVIAIIFAASTSSLFYAFIASTPQLDLWISSFFNSPLSIENFINGVLTRIISYDDLPQEALEYIINGANMSALTLLLILKNIVNHPLNNSLNSIFDVVLNNVNGQDLTVRQVLNSVQVPDHAMILNNKIKDFLASRPDIVTKYTNIFAERQQEIEQTFPRYKEPTYNIPRNIQVPTLEDIINLNYINEHPIMSSTILFVSTTILYTTSIVLTSVFFGSGILG